MVDFLARTVTTFNPPPTFPEVSLPNACTRLVFSQTAYRVLADGWCSGRAASEDVEVDSAAGRRSGINTQP